MARRGQSKPESAERTKAPTTRAVAPSPEARRAVLDPVRGLHATHLLSFGLETGAFQQVANSGVHGINVTELAERAGWFPDYARWFLEAAFALGLLELTSEAGVTPRSRYRLTPAASALLVDEHSPDYAGEEPRLHLLAAQDYKKLPDLYRSGKTFPYSLHGEAFLRSAAAATRALPGAFLRDVLPRLPDLRKRLEEGANVLDVGCGAGWAIVRLAEEFPKCQVTGVDAEPNAIEMAKAWIVLRQLSRRVEARLVRGEELDYEAEFDLATLFLVLHTIPPKQRPAALDHARRALKREGWLLILDEAYPEDAEAFRTPEGQTTVLAQWLEGTWGHRYATRREYRELVESAGFRVRSEVAWGRHHVILAEKAQ
jgi:ubiquinone/menaquinone biosynthesis C-methylase UbiE